MPAEPHKAAACILVRGQGEPEVLLVRRNPSLRFMGGHHVFPGGRICPADGTRHVPGARDAEHAAVVEAAVREIFEETGLLCVRGRLPDAGVLRTARSSLLAGEIEFGEILDKHSLTIEAADFEAAGVWVTPAFSTIRFATQYLLHHVRSDQREELMDGEIVGLDWLRPSEARRLWHRGKLRLSTPVAYTLQLLAGTSVPDAVRMLARGTERAPGEHNRFEIRRGVTLVPLMSKTLSSATHTNCLIVGERRLYVIDPGSDDPAELKHLATQLDHLSELGAEVEAVLLSHSHSDHTAGVDFVRERYKVPVMAHEATNEQVAFRVDRLIADGEVLVSPGDPDWRLRAVHTPGHDPGHLCFLEESTGALLAGDMTANPGTIVVSRNYRGDMAAFMDSLQRLLEIDCKLIIPSHGMPLGDPRRHLREHLEHRLWREQKIRSAYESGARTFDELLAHAYDDAPVEVLPLARHSLDAHLAKLGIAAAR